VYAVYILAIRPYVFLRGQIQFNYLLVATLQLLKAIVPLVMKGYRAISAVVVFKFGEGGCTEAEASSY
jgi:hypothetical protein